MIIPVTEYSRKSVWLPCFSDRKTVAAQTLGLPLQSSGVTSNPQETPTLPNQSRKSVTEQAEGLATPPWARKTPPWGPPCRLLWFWRRIPGKSQCGQPLGRFRHTAPSSPCTTMK